LFWGERVSWTTIAGTALIAVAGLLAARATTPAAAAPAQVV
jgi:drug/metabolite transporter (DMT)-like permease